MSNLLKLPEVMRATALSRSSIYAFIKQGRFPKPLHLGVKAVAWVDTEVTAWVTERADRRDKPKNT